MDTFDEILQHASSNVPATLKSFRSGKTKHSIVQGDRDKLKRAAVKIGGRDPDASRLALFIRKKEEEKRNLTKQKAVEKERLIKLRILNNGGKANKKIAKQFGTTALALQERYGTDRSHEVFLRKQQCKEEEEEERLYSQVQVGVMKALERKRKVDRTLATCGKNSVPHRMGIRKENSLRHFTKEDSPDVPIAKKASSKGKMKIEQKSHRPQDMNFSQLMKRAEENQKIDDLNPSSAPPQKKICGGSSSSTSCLLRIPKSKLAVAVDRGGAGYASNSRSVSDKKIVQNQRPVDRSTIVGGSSSSMARHLKEPGAEKSMYKSVFQQHQNEKQSNYRPLENGCGSSSSLQHRRNEPIGKNDSNSKKMVSNQDRVWKDNSKISYSEIEAGKSRQYLPGDIRYQSKPLNEKFGSMKRSSDPKMMLKKIELKSVIQNRMEPEMHEPTLQEPNRRYLPGDIRYVPNQSNIKNCSDKAVASSTPYYPVSGHIRSKPSERVESGNLVGKLNRNRSPMSKEVSSKNKRLLPLISTSPSNKFCHNRSSISSGYGSVMRRESTDKMCLSGRKATSSNAPKYERGGGLHRREYQYHKNPYASRQNIDDGAEDWEEEDDYDTEMDDFIDDTEVDDFQREDFEQTLKLINPRYDKKRWKMNEMVIDERRMTSNFHDIDREERISSKIGLMEDIREAKLGKSIAL